jgi:stage II sporulation protein AA (anti-sigma F factor antagonist)
VNIEGGIQMKTKYIKEDKLLILKITEEIDHHSCEKIKKRADYEIQIHIPKKVILDFENVNFMDSSGIGMVIGRYKLVSMFGGKTTMINVKPVIKKVFEMSGVLKLIPIDEIENVGGNQIEKCI